MNSDNERIDTTTIDCGAHGKRAWHRDIMCDRCGRVFQTRHPFAPHYASVTCLCGAPLLPEADARHFTGRAICYVCFRQISKRSRGRVPNWKSEDSRVSTAASIDHVNREETKD